MYSEVECEVWDGWVVECGSGKGGKGWHGVEVMGYDDVRGFGGGTSMVTRHDVTCIEPRAYLGKCT